MLLYRSRMFTVGKLKSFLLSQSFLTSPHCQYRHVGQGIKQTYLCLEYPLFQALEDRYDQHNFQT